MEKKYKKIFDVDIILKEKWLDQNFIKGMFGENAYSHLMYTKNNVCSFVVFTNDLEKFERLEYR